MNRVHEHNRQRLAMIERQILEHRCAECGVAFRCCAEARRLAIEAETLRYLVYLAN